jgi:lysophospholipid acyltransferase (LPLAT)-like uncharacterized protein
VKPWKVRLITLTAYCIAKFVYSTMRLQFINEGAIEKERAEGGRGVLLASWHGRSFIPIMRFAYRRYWAMISTSRDGELQNDLFKRLNYQTVRGSTSARGAVVAALTMSKELKNGGVLALTPDGPRGPHHHVHPGVIFFAEKSGCKVIPAGISSWPRYQFKTWDSYVLPLPFSRGVMIFGEPLEVPPTLNEKEREDWCIMLAGEINALEAKAEQMVRPASQLAAVRSDARV